MVASPDDTMLASLDNAVVEIGLTAANSCNQPAKGVALFVFSPMQLHLQ